MSVLFEGFYASSISTFHLLYIVVLGIVTKKLKIVQDGFEKSLSKVVTNVVLPCFIFSQIVNNFNIEQFQLVLFALLGCCFLFIFGLIMGYLIAKFLGLSYGKTRFLAAVFSTPHTTSIPVILIQVVGPVLDKIIPLRPGMLVGTAQQRGFLYIVMNSIFSNIWRWSGAYYLIEPEDENEMEKDIETPLLIKDEPEENKKTIKDDSEHSAMYTFFTKIINAPLVTSVFSLLLTAFPLLQSYFTEKGALLNVTLISVNNMVSKSYSFICMFMLGLSFANSISWGNDSQTVSKNFLTGCDLFWLSIMKLVVMPLLACPFLIFLFRNLLQTDDVLVFIYLFMASAPSAINIIVICAYKDAYTEAVSMLMVVMYAASIVTMTLQVTFFIYLLGNLNAPDMPVIPVA